MNLELLYRIRKLAIRALFSDDILLEALVLKGGNALDMIHKISKRGSLDLDFSIQGDFSDSELETIRERINNNFFEIFSRDGFNVFDIVLKKRPQSPSKKTPKYWGGYLITFKVIETHFFNQLPPNERRKYSIESGPGHHKTFKIDISKYEYCRGKMAYELDGLTIYVYTIEMILIEKIRALCQQLPEYVETTGTYISRARGRDFFDIYTIMESEKIDLSSTEIMDLIKVIFSAKRVPLHLIGKLQIDREKHSQDFSSLKDTVMPDTNLMDFEFYFNYVVEKLDALKPLWEIDTPAI